MKRITIFFYLLFLAAPSFAARGFNGSSDLVSIPAVGTAVDISATPMTVSFWMFPTLVDGSEHDAIAKFGVGAANQQYLFGIGDPDISGGSAMGYYIGSVSNFFGVRASCGVITANHWYHVIVRVDSTNILGSGPVVYMAVSGFVNCTTFSNFTERRSAGGVALNFGGKNAVTNFPGRVCEVGFWDTVLLAGELAALQSGKTPKAIRRTHLVAYYPLYGAKSPEPDLSGGVNNGTLTGTSVANHCPVSP